jgi:hypothetical protein
MSTRDSHLRVVLFNIVSLLAVIIVSAACVTDHGALAKRPQEDAGAGGSGTGGASGAGASAGTLPTDASHENSDVEAPPEEPPGSTVVTLLHAVADARDVSFCFARVDAGREQTAIGVPLPEAPLPFGASVATGSGPGFDFARDDMLPIMLAGDAMAIGGRDCAAAVALARSSEGGSEDAATPSLVARALPMIPAGTLAAGRSYLLVVSGCMGLSDHVDPAQHIVCGHGYTPQTPTLELLLLRLSRITQPAALGLQVVNASLATERFDLRSSAPEAGSEVPLSLANNVIYGAIVPNPARVDLVRSVLGIDSGHRLEVLQSGSLVLQRTWIETIATGRLDDIENGNNYTVLLIGPVPTVGGERWWNMPTLSIVANDPAL